MIAATDFTVALVASACFAPAQQATTKRNYDAEIEAAQPDAKDAAGFEFQGTLVRTCLLPVSRGEAATRSHSDVIHHEPRQSAAA